MKLVDLNSLVHEVRAVASERPDYYAYTPPTGKKCVYHQYDPEGNIIPGAGCLVGEAFLRLGVQVPREYNGESVVDLENIIGEFDNHNPLYFWLAEVQENQDHGKTWRDSITEADEALEKAREFGQVEYGELP